MRAIQCTKGQSILRLSIYVQLVFAASPKNFQLPKFWYTTPFINHPEHPDKHHHYPNSHPEHLLMLLSEDFWLSFLTEEHPPEVKPDLSPPVVKKKEPVIIEVEIKAKDGAVPVATATPPTASSGSGRRKKKQKVEPVVTGKNKPKSDKLKRLKFSVESVNQ